MRRRPFIWGSLLVIVGVLLLLQNLGVITGSIWGIFWPLFLIFLGIRFLVGFMGRGSQVEPQSLDIPLNNASQAVIQVKHGAGRLKMDASARPGSLLSGSFEGGVDCQQQDAPSGPRIELQPGRQAAWDFPWGTGFSHGFGWTIGISPQVSISLDLNTGADESLLDLSQLKVSDLRLETGASSTTLVLPAAAGSTQARIKSGVASMNIEIPMNTEARIEVKSGLSGVDVDTRRFIQSGNVYESAGFGSAVNRIFLSIETGVGSVSIH